MNYLNGVVSDDEIPDFVHIQKQLDQIDHTVEALKLWVASTISEGNINAQKLTEYSMKASNPSHM